MDTKEAIDSLIEIAGKIKVTGEYPRGFRNGLDLAISVLKEETWKERKDDR